MFENICFYDVEVKLFDRRSTNLYRIVQYGLSVKQNYKERVAEGKPKRIIRSRYGSCSFGYCGSRCTFAVDTKQYADLKRVRVCVVLRLLEKSKIVIVEINRIAKRTIEANELPVF